MGSMSTYSAPAYTARDEDKIGWGVEARQEAESWMKTQRPARDWDQAIDLLAGDDMAIDIDAPSSGVKVLLTKRIAREITASMSNIRFASSYRTDNNDWDANCHVLNIISTAWYVNTFADRRIKDACQYAVGMGTGYASPFWNPDFHTRGRGDVQLGIYGPRDVLPIQLPRDHDLQRAYAIGFNDEMPINLARRVYSKHAGDIHADRDVSNQMAKGLAATQRFVAPGLRVGNTNKEKERDSGFKTVDVMSYYIDDPAVNLTDRTIPMGKPGTSWFYEVPYHDQEIPTTLKNSGGQTLYRKANWDDCRLYPLKRRMILTKSVLLEDDTSPWWHGMFPVVRLCFDKMAWDALGMSIARDVAPIERSNNRLYRGIDDSMNVRLAPPVQFDENVVSRSLMETIDLRAPREEVAINGSLGDPIKPILQADYYNWPPNLPEHIEKMRELALWLTGAKDVTALSKAKQIPAGDSLEKLLEMIGPLATDNARSMEEMISKLGVLTKPLFFQFYSTKRRIQIGGGAATVEADYDYDPGNMVPSHLEGENKDQPSSVKIIDRARAHHENFYYWVKPQSLHQMTQMSKKLMLLNLMKNPSFPLDPWSIAKVMDFDDDFGPEPEGTHNMIERWRAWRIMQLEEQVEEAKAMQAAGIEPGAGKGRPNSNKKPPKNQTKDGGTRTTTATS